MFRPSRRRLLSLGAALGTVTLAGCLGFTGPAVSERSSRSIPVDGFDRLAVAGRNGDVTVERAPGDTVELEVEKRGRTQAAIDRLDVVNEVVDGRLQVTVEYPDTLSNVVVDLSVALPEGVALSSAQTGNGDATVRGVSGDATVTSANGDARALEVDGFVTVESANGDAVARGTTGVVAGRTANGDVDVEVFALRDLAEFTNANGSIDVGVASDLDASVTLSVGNGDINVDADLDVTAERRDRIEGRLGDGGPRLRASSGNGDVRLYEL
jgi:hypothetical protein